MVKEMLKVELKPDTDLAKVVDDVCRDGVPRLLERDGVPVAMVSKPGEVAKSGINPTGHFDREKFLSFAGAWEDIDADALIEYIYKGRHEAPPSPPVTFDVSS
ncbi:MAG: hypothetical protein HY681_05595 [Chloroflexi bacterium]|nr:hypothetical protein [Chloroflexota bacterium]